MKMTLAFGLALTKTVALCQKVSLQKSIDRAIKL